MASDNGMQQERLSKEQPQRKPKKFDLGSDVDKEEIFTYPYLTDDSTTDCIKEHGRIMIIIRGPNSTLKATLSEMIQKRYPTAQHCCADHYFTKTFSPPDRTKDTLTLAHGYCEKKVEAACQKNESPIVVQNTHIRKSELQKYLDMASEYNYTVIMAITLYKFNITPEALEAINPDGLNLRYFRNRLRQWEDIPPVFTGWFLGSDDATYVLKLLQTTLPVLLSDGKFCRVFDFFDDDGLWNYFDARRNLYCMAGYSYNKFLMKRYYLSDLVQECYGKSYCITIQGYLVTTSAIMGIVQIDEEMSQLVLEEKSDVKDDTLSVLLTSLDLSSNKYKDTVPFDHKNSESGKTAALEDWLDETIDTKTCRLIHLAQKRLEPFTIREVEEQFSNTMRSLSEDLQYDECEGGVQTCRLSDDKWLIKLPQKLTVKTIFTGLYI